MPDGQPIGRRGDARSRMARISDELPFRPYVYNGTGQDIYRGAVGHLDDVRRRAAARHQESVPDIGPGPEWYRERAAGDEDLPAAMPVSAPPAAVRTPAPALALVPALDDELAELAAARDRYQAVLAALDGPAPQAAPPPVTAASRCGRCGYLTSAVGHRVACDE